jgi:Ca2+-binding RTX toxin-like protein
MAYVFAYLLIPHIIKLSYTIIPIPIEIIGKSPPNKQANVPPNELNKQGISALFDVRLDNNDTVMNLNISLKKENSTQNIIGKSNIDKYKITFIPSHLLEKFTKYIVEVDYNVKNLLGKISNDTKRWSFTTNSGLNPPEERPCTSIFIANKTKNAVEWYHADLDKLNLKVCNKGPLENKNDNNKLNTAILENLNLGNNNPVQGSPSSDKIYGSDTRDIIIGAGGNDTIYGGDNDDIISGGNDSDYISGRNGRDFIVSGNPANEGNDTSIDEINAGNGNDIIISDGHDLIDCGPGDDHVNYYKNNRYLNCEKIMKSTSFQTIKKNNND